MHFTVHPAFYSARWGGPEKDFNVAMRKVEDSLDTEAARCAHFICVLALAWPDGHCEFFEGIVRGEVVWPPRGARGFGYDPIFIPDTNEDNRTFAEMTQEEKSACSHRSRALRALFDFLNENGD